MCNMCCAENLDFWRRTSAFVGVATTVVCGVLHAKNDIAIFNVIAVKMNEVSLRRSSVFSAEWVPFALMFITTTFTVLQCVSKKMETAVMLRWADWLITVPVMMALISVLCGMREAFSVFFQALLAFFTIFTGIQCEHLKGRVYAATLVLGNVTMIVSWISVIWHISMTNAPGFVIAIVVVQLVMFMLYPVFYVLKELRGWSVEKTESVFVVLGMLTKSALALILAIGVKTTSKL